MKENSGKQQSNVTPANLIKATCNASISPIFIYKLFKHYGKLETQLNLKHVLHTLGQFPDSYVEAVRLLLNRLSKTNSEAASVLNAFCEGSDNAPALLQDFISKNVKLVTGYQLRCVEKFIKVFK